MVPAVVAVGEEGNKKYLTKMTNYKELAEEFINNGGGYGLPLEWAEKGNQAIIAFSSWLDEREEGPSEKQIRDFYNNIASHGTDPKPREEKRVEYCYCLDKVSKPHIKQDGCREEKPTEPRVLPHEELFSHRNKKCKCFQPTEPSVCEHGSDTVCPNCWKNIPVGNPEPQEAPYDQPPVATDTPSVEGEDISPYCAGCGGCGEVGCDGIEGFLVKHVRGKTDCMHEESFIRDIIETYEYLKTHDR